MEDADSTVEEDIVEVEDPATARVVDSPEAFDVWEYVVFSSTFQVPALMFSVHTKCQCCFVYQRDPKSDTRATAGSPVSLDGILNTTLFHWPAFVGAEKTTFALQTPNQPFPMLSQAEHPTIGTPCWCLHPCATSEALKELQEADGYENSASPGRLLELWLLLIGNVVDFSQ